MLRISCGGCTTALHVSIPNWGGHRLPQCHLWYPTNSAVDEISIQALITQLGYKLIYEPGCVVYNKGPLTVRDFLKQRRRIYAGHLKVRTQQNYEASTMKVSPIIEQLLSARDFTMSNPKQAM